MQTRAGIQEFIYKNNYDLCLSTIKLDQIFDGIYPAILQEYKASSTLSAQTASKTNKTPTITAKVKKITLINGIEYSQFRKNDGYTPEKVINKQVYTYCIYPVTVTLNCEFNSPNLADILNLATYLICLQKRSYTLKNELLPIDVRFNIKKDFEIPEVPLSNSDLYKFSFTIDLQTYVGNIMVEPEINTLVIETQAGYDDKRSQTV